MNITKIVGYICVAAISIVVTLVFKDMLTTIVSILIGFYLVSNDGKNN